MTALSLPAVLPKCITKAGCCVLLSMVACRIKIPWVPSGFVKVRPKPANPGFSSGVQITRN